MAQPNVGCFTHYISGNVSAAADKCKWIMPRAGRIIDAVASVGTNPATTTITADINKNGTSIFTNTGTVLTVSTAGVDSVTLPTALADRAFAAGDTLSYDLDQVGTGTTGANYAITVFVEFAL